MPTARVRIGNLSGSWSGVSGPTMTRLVTRQTTRRILQRRCPSTSARGGTRPRSATPRGCTPTADHHRPWPAVTTGAIGGLLSLAVLWAMLPSAGRGGDAAPTVVHQHCQGLSSAQHHRSVPTPSSRRSLDDSTLPSHHRSARRVDHVLPRRTDIDQPRPSRTDDRRLERHARPRRTSKTAPVAVGIGDSLVVTTARAR